MEAQNYWINTSSNDIVRRFISQADAATKDEIEQLINGGIIRKKIRQELTYRDLDSNIENLWSILFTTGYLTQCGQDDEGMTGLVIPNKEIRWIYEEQIQDWFHKETRKDVEKLENLGRAFEENNIEGIEKGLTSYLRKTISIRDTNAKKEMKENFYHGLLLGLLNIEGSWIAKSNIESGIGYTDIKITVPAEKIGCIIEVKYAEKGTV